jgi:hypothetical protein
MKVMLHLREGVTPARFKIDLSRAIRSGEHKAWEVVRARPDLVIRHKGRFRSNITIKPGPRRVRSTDHRPPDLVATMTGEDAVLVLRYLVYLIARKLGDQIEGFYVPVDEP